MSASPRIATHAGVGHPLMSATPDRFDSASGFAYVKGLMAPWLMATGLTPDSAWDVARRVEDHLAGSGRDRVSLEELRATRRDVLGGTEGDDDRRAVPALARLRARSTGRWSC